MAVFVRYDTPRGPVMAETLTNWKKTLAEIDPIREVLRDAYVAELAQKLDIIGKAPLDKHYSPSNHEARKRFVEVTKDIHDRGSRITVLRDPRQPGKLLGFSKLGPASCCNSVSKVFNTATG
ncbi:MAG TPA: hypothetical protein VJR27_02205 [Candidatus Saccharimonadales bacterium]|nr:hypothetical protein [Candidatus Saccharimonadales bacterium]